MEAAQKILNEIIDRMGVESYEIEYREGYDEHSFNIIGLSDRDTALLIGRQGENLFALQYVFRAILRSQDNPQFDISDIVLDIMSYRQRQVDHLTILAKRKAQEAKMDDREIELRPMNAYERRIIHMALKEDNFIETLSRGEDPDRRVVIRVVKKMVDI